MLKKFFKKKLQKGQALVFFAIAVPTLFMFVAAVVEFGWWFINQSRLQNAADAAVLAGVNAMLENADENTVLSYDFVNRVPDGYSESAIEKDATGDATALTYAEKNFAYVPFRNETNFFERHSYRNSALASATNTTTQNYFLYPMYYEVELRGQVQHLFSILNNFGEMPLHVKAVAKVSQSIIAPLEKLKVKNVITGNWEIQNRYKMINETTTVNEKTVWTYYDKRVAYQKASGQETLFTGQWNHYKEPNKNIYYTDGNLYRHEVVTVLVTQDSVGKNKAYKDYGSAFKTPANSADGKGRQWSWQEVESINLDWAQDFSFSFKSDGYSVYDWDIGYKLPSDISSIVAQGNNKDGKKWTLDQLNHRIHGLITFYEAFPSIAKKLDSNGKEDENNGNYYYSPLWARIESEPMWSYLGPSQKQAGLDTVHQIIININESNWMEEDDDGFPIPIAAPEKYHTSEQIIYRPLIFFYEGPETNMDNMFMTQAKIPAVETDARKRQSKPIILNLNADFCGAIYAPNSPVTIVPNRHKFKGFVVAKSYKLLKTSGFSSDEDVKEITHANTDMYGNSLPSLTVYIKRENPAGNENDTTLNTYERYTEGNVQFKDATAEEVENTLPSGSKYSIFNIEELKDTFFDPDNPYRPQDESVHILMTLNG